MAICSALGVSTTSGVVVGAISGLTGGVIGGFINGAGFTALGGGNFQESMMGGLKGAVIGGGTGALAGGVFGGISAFKAGNNVWTGKDIAYGRNAFSFKNTPVINKPAPVIEPLPTSVGTVDVPQPTGSTQISENVQKTLEQLDQIRQDGGIVQPNQLSSQQEINITIKHNDLKLDLRIETHPLPPKYGGDYLTPIRHMNIDLTPKSNLPLGGHKLLIPSNKNFMTDTQNLIIDILNIIDEKEIICELQSSYEVLIESIRQMDSAKINGNYSASFPLNRTNRKILIDNVIKHHSEEYMHYFEIKSMENVPLFCSYDGFEITEIASKVQLSESFIEKYVRTELCVVLDKIIYPHEQLKNNIKPVRIKF